MARNKFVLDTHVWFSIFHNRTSELLINALIEHDIILISNDEQSKELLDVIHRPQLQGGLNKKPEDYIAFMIAITETHRSSKRFSLLWDYKDNYLVDLAWQSKSILVSDDKHFAPLKKLTTPTVKVISKSQFYKIIGL